MRLTRKTKLIRDDLIHYARKTYKDITLEELGTIFNLTKTGIYRILESKVESN